MDGCTVAMDIAHAQMATGHVDNEINCWLSDNCIA